MNRTETARHDRSTAEHPGAAAAPAQPFDDGTVEGSSGSGFEVLVERPPPGLIRRFLTTERHFLGLALGGLGSYVRTRRQTGAKGLRFRLIQLLALMAAPWVKRDLRKLPFPIQLRRRLEILGPTYIKLGQILSLREDLLPRSVTDELKHLLDRLPAVPFPRFLELVGAHLGRPVEEMFLSVEAEPIGSASIAQAHRAVTREGDSVILKVVKPGIREILIRDTRLLRMLGATLQLFLARYQPRRVLNEFCDYTLKEVDLRREADNAETFAANFQDLRDVVFPEIFRDLSNENVLCMEFLDGIKPNTPQARELAPEEKETLIDLGASAIIRMLYRDGFFHADLHPGNLLILPGPRVGFIDLGMVGRFNENLRRTLLYYYYCLVMGDAANAARYLAAIAEPAPGADPQGFYREVEEISHRWHRSATFEDFSLGQLIMESVSLGAEYRMYFPVEMVLMVKALVTFEGVGQILRPGFDVAAVSQAHINRIFLHQFSPIRLARESLRGAPEVVDALVKAPLLVTEGLRVLEQSTRRPRENPFAGMRGTMFGGFCLVAGAIIAAADGPWPLWAGLFAVGVLLALRSGE